MTLLEAKKMELEGALSQANRQITQSNADRMSLRVEVDRLNKELGVVKAQMQTLQKELETCQAQRSHVESSDIQKKYQVSSQSIF